MSDLVIRNLSDQLVDLVRDRILAGSVPPERAIRQDALAAELGISKIPLREALTRLEEEGLVYSRVNRGYFVTPLTALEAEEIYSLRLRLEPDLVALAAQRADEADHELAIAAFEKLNDRTAADDASVGAFNRAFHLALIRPSGQVITTNLLERLHVLGERYVRKHLEPLGRDKRASYEHRTILDLWLAGDGKAVTKMVRAHIRSTLLDLRRQFAAHGV